jgi:flagellar biosynthesis protein FliR
MLQTLHASFLTLSPTPLFVHDAPGFLASHIDQSHAFGITMIGPLGTCLFVTLITTAMAMRVWPQINLFSFGIGFRILVGLIAAWYFLPYALAQLQRFYVLESARLSALFSGR